jgi:hypothetical protein
LQRQTHLKPRGAIWLFGLALAIAPFAGPVARADSVPGLGEWEHYHFSLDESPVTVVLVNDSGRRDFPILTVPRSYIYYAEGAPPSTAGPLPDSIETNTLGLAFADPDGEAWSVAIEKYAARSLSSSNAAAKALRTESYNVEVLTSHPQFADLKRKSLTRRRTSTGRLYGPEEYVGKSSTMTYYIGDAADEFISATCPNPLNPRFFCEYMFMVDDGDVFGRIHFSDFRAFGGRDYANRRIRFARQTICRFLEEC